MTLNSWIHVVYDNRAIKSTTNTRFTSLFVRYICNYSWSMLRQLKVTCTNSNRTLYCHEKTMECSRNNVHFYVEEQQQQMTCLWHHYDIIMTSYTTFDLSFTEQKPPVHVHVFIKYIMFYW